jgi:hypothetical protein
VPRPHHAVVPEETPIAPSPYVRVISRGLRWSVVRPGDTVPESTHDGREDALRAARVVAALCDTDVVVCGPDGTPVRA